MEIIAQHLGKRYSFSHWVIKDFSHQFVIGKRYGISGPNGSGKSTLINLLTGINMPSKGEVKFRNQDNFIELIDWYKYYSFAAPYASLFDYLTTGEIVEFHLQFKMFIRKLSLNDFITIARFSDQKDKMIKQFSSGMKQRLKLALAILSDTPFLFLDEPLTNLDDQTKEWYFNLLDEYSEKRCVIIASNDTDDFKRVDELIKLG